MGMKRATGDPLLENLPKFTKNLDFGFLNGCRYIGNKKGHRRSAGGKMDSCDRRARRDKVKQAWRVQRALTKNILHCRYTFKCICKYILIYWKTFCLANSEIFFFSNWAALKYVPRNPLFKHQYFPAPPYCWIHCLHKSGNLWKVFALHFKTEHSLSSQYIQHWLKGLREAHRKNDRPGDDGTLRSV